MQLASSFLFGGVLLNLKPDRTRKDFVIAGLFELSGVAERAYSVAVAYIEHEACKPCDRVVVGNVENGRHRAALF